MKICIITIYNSLNSGGFLQAYALMKTLEEYGHEVVFLDTGVESSNRYMFGTIVGSIATLNFARAAFNYNKWRGFLRDQEVFHTIKNRPGELLQCDLFIFGSDEIWNVNTNRFARNPILWGQGIESKNLVAYAPSINRATLEKIKALKYPQTCLEKFSSIMVRDEHTRDVISQLTQKEVTVVIDPTLLLEREEYAAGTPKIPKDEYILLYSYGSHKKKCQIDNIKRFAKMKNLKLVSANDWFGWCDANLPVAPFEFVELLKNAKYVISDTFHGTVFSILFSRQFVTYAGDNIKVIDLLKRFGLQSRTVEPDSDLQPVMDTRIDYEKIHGIRESFREKSLLRLRDAIDASNLNSD